MQNTLSAARTAELRQAAEIFATLVRRGGRIARLSGVRPDTLEDSYAVQNAVVAAMGPVGGWKVSPLRPGGDPRCSPLPQAFFRETPAILSSADLAACSVEAEVAVRLARDLPAPNRIPGPNAVAAAIGSIHLAIELVSSRFERPAEAPDFHRLADLQNSAGVVLGRAMTKWHTLEVADLPLGLSLDGEDHATNAQQPTTERTLAAIGWLAAHAQSRGLPLTAGQTIITGARLGPIAIGGGNPISATAGKLGRVEIRNGT